MWRFLAGMLVPLLLAPGHAPAHDGKTHVPQATAAAVGEAISQTVTVDPGAPEAQTLTFAQGTHVELTIQGAGSGELHFHGYDIGLDAVEGQPALLIFEAIHAGRFPLAMHVEDPLLGPREKAVLYVEVRAP